MELTTALTTICDQQRTTDNRRITTYHLLLATYQFSRPASSKKLGCQNDPHPQ